MAAGVGPQIAVDLEVGSPDGPQPLDELVRRNIEPDDVSATEQPSPERRVGDDPVRGDHPAQRRAGVRLFGEADPRDDIRAPGGVAGEVDEPGAPAFGQGLPDASSATARCPDQHGFHRPPTMPRRPDAMRVASLPSHGARRNPLDRRLRFRKIGQCPTLWNGYGTNSVTDQQPRMEAQT